LTKNYYGLKLNDYIQNPLVIQCADKYRVREYIEKCGYSHLLNELLGVYEHAKDIDWNSLPEKFVLKWNFGAGMNILCENKENLNITQTVKQLNKWEKLKYWLPYSEMQYKNTPKRIICEKYLDNTDELGVIPDYKVYCFHGEPLAILVMHDRGHEMKTEFFDINWNSLENTNKYKEVKEPTKEPSCLKEMLEASRSFSTPFPFVRCDFYIISGKLYFGELTFTPAGGLYVSQTKINGKGMEEYLHIPSE
ncbi:ATP-grasp fold amidoligase family protein, partial [Coprococcus sp. AF21-14LB]|uniref:ATP-grasp fold amidoligase family protein n=1 Tax=Coprococcus sp. AF21-14LB TaxID=2292231 RepID=UPI000E50D3F6